MPVFYEVDGPELGEDDSLSLSERERWFTAKSAAMREVRSFIDNPNEDWRTRTVTLRKWRTKRGIRTPNKWVQNEGERWGRYVPVGISNTEIMLAMLNGRSYTWGDLLEEEKFEIPDRDLKDGDE